MFKFIKSMSLGFLFFTFSLFFQNQQIFASELINSFYSRIEINQDTSLSITEQIDYTTTVSKHGIYRYIPVNYNKDGQVEVLQLSNIKVTNDQGKAIPYTRSLDGRFVTLKIGDPDNTFSGNKIYIIYYQVERGINQFEDHDELYWDITGEGWTVPILKSSATIISKYADIKDSVCYSGAFGDDDGLCNFEAAKNQATFTYLNKINYGDNMTVVLSFLKDNQFIFPTQFKLFLYWLKNNWPIILLPFPLIIMFIWWFKKGRDLEFISPDVFDLDPDKPTRLKPIQLKSREPMVYAPLKDLTPGESGALIDGKVDVQDVIAEILELARKKYLKISVVEKKVLFSKSRDYTFKKLLGSTREKNNVQTYLLNEIFKTGDIIKLSSLKGKFYTTIGVASSMINESLVLKGLYTTKQKEITTGKTLLLNSSGGNGSLIVRSKGIGFLVYFLMTGLLFLIFQINLTPLGIYWPIIVLVIQVPFGLLIVNNLTQKSAVGTNLWLQSRGLKASIRRGTWREKINEKNLFIEEILPFAVALGVVKQLSRDMNDLDIQSPDYISTTGLTSLAMTDFVSNFSKEVGSSLSYNPSSSSSSGSSGFSGGSSGGGGGGGGGGSW